MILVNGHPSDRVDALDRGLAYGDGVFRTLRTAAGMPLWWRDHYAKLASDCAALALDCPDEGVLRDEVCRVAGEGAAVAKIILTRGAGVRGYTPPPVQTPTRIVMGLPLPAHAHPEAVDGITARGCTLRLAQQPRLAGIKHLNRLENVLARAEWDDPTILEGILCDTDGMLVGGVMSNLLWVAQGILHTPDLSASGVAGVARAPVARGAASRTRHACRPLPASGYTRCRGSDDLQQRPRRAPHRAPGRCVLPVRRMGRTIEHRIA